MQLTDLLFLLFPAPGFIRIVSYSLFFIRKIPVPPSILFFPFPFSLSLVAQYFLP
jgi:hypothetical protein